MTVQEFQMSGNLTVPPAAPKPLGTPVFIGGQFGYDTYRIPALAVTNAGTVLAVCEGRRHSDSDSGDIDLLLRRSVDNGQTWAEQQVIWDDAGNTCGNPCLVVDRDTGVIWLLVTWNRGDDHEPRIIDQTSHDTRRVYVCHSENDGLAWSKPSEITASTKLPAWTWYATGPGSGIQLQHGAHRGRLVIPCDHIEAGTKRYLSHVIYSDDHGATWQLGGTSPRDRVNECEVVELSDGRLMLNMRNYDRTKRSRQIAFSDDGGQTWRDQRFDATLIEPICQAAVDRCGDVLLFSNPASAAERIRLTVRASFDDGSTWPRSHLLYAGPSGYSDLAVLANGEIGCLYECGVVRSTEDIVFARLALDELQ
ncbi:MAG: exo-alpha-sialidase [Armatimonadetes bacterium]|nr:exo-alpha-sialidase [Armatimonadota bacterium]